MEAGDVNEDSVLAHVDGSMLKTFATKISPGSGSS